MKLIKFKTPHDTIFFVNPEHVVHLHVMTQALNDGPTKGTMIFFSGGSNDNMFTPTDIEDVANMLSE